MLIGNLPTQETFPLVRYFLRKIFRRLKPIIRQNTPMPSEKVIHIYRVFRRLVGQHSNRSVLTPNLENYHHFIVITGKLLRGGGTVVLPPEGGPVPIHCFQNSLDKRRYTNFFQQIKVEKKIKMAKFLGLRLENPENLGNVAAILFQR